VQERVVEEDGPALLQRDGLAGHSQSGGAAIGANCVDCVG
jgi:hypothetical protein